MREGMGMAISLGGMCYSPVPLVQAVRLFAAAFGLLLLPKCKPVGCSLSSASRGGDSELYHQAFTLLLLGLGVMLLALLGFPLIEGVGKARRVWSVSQILFLGPNSLSQVPLAQLERSWTSESL